MLANWFTFLTAATAALAAALPVAGPDTSAVNHELIRRVGGGVNDWNCKSTLGRDPVIFMHGLTAPAGINWISKAPIVAAQGYCVFTPQYGTVNGVFFGFASMRDSSKEIAGIVQQVLSATGASKVNLVGHSMGTTVAAYYMKFDGGDKLVNRFIGFGANYKGTTLYGLNKIVAMVPGISPAVRAVCASCDEFLPPSSFIDDLNNGGITVPGPDYTTIASQLDEVVIPYTSGIINEPGVTNIVIQQKCGLIPDLSGHFAQAVDPNVTAWILWALAGKNGPMPGCVPSLTPS
ncbi:hypothetical protein CspeluHIS016_0405430 [Cutaneotrichosporon spelunceum]|uniref:Alpha/beta-hydrolase n=1 Tax=Cutaneotrichosporon spelunceum TaxID=1672016 RepID=A0AAD3TWD3_9TREE|nr:hypothetical protein CspeluHIS016_0405430 [Cutaneotrichosporon spelunceum]